MPNRRYLTFNLRTLLILLTGSAVWLGITVDRAREQREAVEAIESLGGYVVYDWQAPSGNAEQPTGPAWLRRTVGDDFFQDVFKAGFDSSRRPSDILKAIGHLKRLRKLNTVIIPYGTSAATLEELKAALPNSEISPVLLCSSAPSAAGADSLLAPLRFPFLQRSRLGEPSIMIGFRNR